ncbi:hypothetical protein FRC20_011172 [Serendipita sp. 405]|nr:hypothetical protein FRC18_004970 [Serendipita sp. 400]KAG8877503.1 hypothetical protein FRC20_011172 [Serendipita sp. 405]
MPGGNLEVIVENIVFPYVPRIVPQSPSVPSTPIRTTFALENHDHSFLEEVFFSIFDRRFINVKPTSIVPASMNLYLRGVSEVPLQVPASTQSPKEKQRTTLPGAPGNAKSTVPFPQTDASVNRFSGWANELRAWQKVLGCKETMWEEILEKNRVLQKDILDDLLWSPNERELLSSRGRFDLLFSRYAQEMRQRIRLASKLMKGIGWIEPGQCVENTLGVLQGDLDVLEGGKIALSQSPGGEEIDATQQISCWVAHKGEDFQLQAR